MISILLVSQNILALTDSAILGHVDVGIRSDLQDLLLGQASETEHADLVDDVVPVARSLQLVELALESLAHRDDTTAHLTKVLLPLGEQLLVIENHRCNAGTVCRRVTDLGTLENGQLTTDAGCSIGSVRTRTSDEVEATSTLAIKTEVLCVTLSYEHLEALLDEVTDSPSILVQIAGCETLVCAVEEGELGLALHERGNLLPLVLGRVDTCGVVCASVKQDDTAFWSLLYRLDHTLEVKTLGLSREVWVVLDGKLDIGEDLVVVGPCRVGNVDGLGLGGRGVVELGQESGAQVDSASA
jgi:hypothetical protein